MHLTLPLKAMLVALLTALAAMVYWATFNWSSWMIYITSQQKELHGKLSEHMANVASQPEVYGVALITLSFLYGVFHAVGPGHGKAVIMTYVGTQGATVKKGAALSFAAAMLQALVAVVLVSIIGQVLKFSFAEVNSMGEQLTLVGYALVISLGTFILFKAGRKLVRSLRAMPDTDHHEHAHHHEHHHHHEHAHQHTDEEHKEHSHAHAHDHSHQHGEGCGCSHTVEVKEDANWLQNLTLVFSMGLRPCSGALIVLTYAYLVDAYEFGVLATFAMGFGTGISIALIAAGTVFARSFFERLIESPSSNSASLLANAGLYLQIAGGVLLIIFGWGLLSAALQTAAEHPLMLGG
jgi:ABC-type nickel/cobalt efflux system permease component RcnA